jgi:hypothetical protein
MGSPEVAIEKFLAFVIRRIEVDIDDLLEEFYLERCYSQSMRADLERTIRHLLETR